MPKQFLERMTVIRAGDVVLEGLFHQGRSAERQGLPGGDAEPVVLAPPLPGLGGTMEHAVLAELCWALTRAGHATLRFNYRGVGASSGQLSTPTAGAGDLEVSAGVLDEAYADLSAAIEQHLETCGAPRCAVVGYSFGAAVAAHAGVAHPAVERVVLIAPPVRHLPFDFAALASAGVPTTILCGELDATAPPGAVAEAVAGAFHVRSVPGANHAFTRGLSPLGRLVVQSFPGGERDDDDAL